MYALGIETSGPVCSVGLVDEEGVLAERAVRGLRRHSVRLMDLVASVLEDGGIGLADLGMVAVGVGPGSFTGLRIGAAVARTLAQVRRLPAVGIGTLDVLAHPLGRCACFIGVVVASRRNEVYMALYRGGEGDVRRLFGPVALSPDQAAEQLAQLEETVILAGDAAPCYHAAWQAKTKARLVVAPAHLQFPRGAVVAEMALARLRKGEDGDLYRLLPVYVNAPATRSPGRG
ncbi:MAG: Universal protein YeaZ [Clostridia bacterium 62_21]|nr:MAG: Universal protein YeaZ [Clostridia bacterium 62_21]